MILDLNNNFRFGRMSMPVLQAFSCDQLLIYEMMTAPDTKEGRIVGWNEDVETMYGRRPDPYICVLSADAIDYRSHFIDWDAFIMSGKPSSDLPTEGLSAMLYGALLIVDDIPDWRSLVEDGVTGWLCKSEREFIYKASRCAHETEEREEMVSNARRKLLTEYADHPHVQSLFEFDSDSTSHLLLK